MRFLAVYPDPAQSVPMPGFSQRKRKYLPARASGRSGRQARGLQLALRLRGSLPFRKRFQTQVRNLPMQKTTTPTSSSSLDTREATERAHAGIDRIRNTAHETVDQAADAASSAADRLSARGEEWVATKDEWVETTREYVREHPVAAVTMALAAGYLLSRLTGR
jgi:ElaB/YqjD/DUF883 family membrane-anchored ribosome-binding protein